MNTHAISRSPLGKSFIRVLAAGMESRFRYRFFGPMNILRGADLLPGQRVLEVGCGTGYFTLPAARWTGEQGCLVALDIFAESVELVSKKVQTANLTNVCVVKGDALDTGSDPGHHECWSARGRYGDGGLEIAPVPLVPFGRIFDRIA
jgi:SAM-dependent methyltransferase